MKAQQLSALPRMSSSQVTTYPQQSPYVPAVAPAQDSFDMTGMMGMMVSLIMIVMVMKMMMKVTEAV